MQVDLKGVSVMIVMPVNRDLPWQTAQSLLETTVLFMKMGIDFDIQFVVGSSIVEVARSKAAHVFLKSDKQKMFMIDSDQAWTAKDAARMLAMSTKMKVVCAAYPAKKDPAIIMMNPFTEDVEANEFGCIPIKGIGLGFTIVAREVVGAISEKSEKLVFPESDELVPFMFRCDAIDGIFRGEDMAFFDDCRKLGHTVWIDPALNVGHIGAKQFTASLKDAMVRADQDDHST